MRLRRAFINALAVWAVLCTLASSTYAQLQITIQPGSGLQSNTQALQAFDRAAQTWESLLTTPVPVNVVINADLSNLGSSSIIGQTGFTGNVNLDYTTVRNAMAARATLPGNQVLAFLPTSPIAHVPTGTTLDTSTIGITRANQKILGLLTPLDATYSDPDANISFNTNFSFYYGSSGSVPANLIDFQTAATHELGHVLGFLSDVDDFDGDPTLQSDNLTTLDLFRFNASEIPSTYAAFQTTPREMRPGKASVTSDTVNAYAMSTGVYNGDGNQASHWKDDALTGQYIGIMDPTLAYGAREQVTDADVHAFSLLGYVAVPEPTGAMLLAAAAFVLLLRRRPADVASA